VQLKYYDERCAEIRRAMNYFFDLLEGVPGIHTRRVDERTGSDMAGFYEPRAIYVPEELEGLSITRFCEAVCAEGVEGCAPSGYKALHTHALFQTADVYGAGAPSRIANSPDDIRRFDANLKTFPHTLMVPWLKKFVPAEIEEYASAYKKVVRNYRELLAGDPGDPAELGGWNLFKHTAPKKKA
ncbi:MAG: hypothetical protein IJY22_06370, partial [Clostridia bacterium]|nr:hypothetical protein [Clostridia bacterium]